MSSPKPASHGFRSPLLGCTAHPESSSAGAGAGTHRRWPTSHTWPGAQSLVMAHEMRHAPNTGSQANGPQSNRTAELVGHFAPGAVQTAGPTPVEPVMQRLGAQSVPAPAPMHAPPGPHVDKHCDAAPQSPRKSTPAGDSVHFPGDDGNRHV